MQASLYSSRKQDDSEFNLTELALKARISRRYSTSYIRNIREDITTSTTTTRSFRSNTTISSTASSPGYSFKDEIDPSTYSFNTALKALKTRYHRSSWEWLTPDGGFALNSKWSEAEKYICNPISGEVPIECLSAKSLSRRSFRKSPSTKTNSGITLSVISSRHTQTKPEEQDVNPDGDGTQITPHYLRTSSGSTTLTSSIPERSTKLYNEDSPNSTAIAKSEEQLHVQVEMQGKETWDTTKESEREKNEYMKKDVQLCRQSGCFSWMRHRENHERQRRNNTSFLHFKVC
ncbi:hypothetical protein PIB30_052239 [Stylosanthes scabra]|uniref:Uncharacterized protein n=1 Tax=Stylosanthes scabra TaxID=79078 RepID=A0ABU6TII8_9FABA|nr:hypothetical protein [Stylosanthes scabra]